MLRIASITLLLLAFCGPARADFEAGLAALRKADWAVALEQFRRAGASGDPRALYNVGIMHRNGQGTPRDPAAAAEWFRRAAMAGDAPAQFALADVYRRGLGVPKDEQLAAEWYGRAAAAGMPAAQYNLGRMYTVGIGVPVNDAQAVKLYRAAAEQGMPDAQYVLGLSYLHGRGVPRDIEPAYFWISLSANLGRSSAASVREAIATQALQPTQLARLDKEVQDWLGAKRQSLEFAGAEDPDGRRVR